MVTNPLEVAVEDDPKPLRAWIWKLYRPPEGRPVITADVAPPPTDMAFCAVMPLTYAETRYDVIGAPFGCDALHVTVAWFAPATADGLPGAPGAPSPASAK